jgi:hypothetical protein
MNRVPICLVASLLLAVALLAPPVQADACGQLAADADTSAEGTAQDLIGQYLGQRQDVMAFEPEIWSATESPYTDDVMITLVLAAPGAPDAEFVLARVVSNPGEQVRFLVFSSKLASTGEEEVGQALAKRDDWVADLAGFSLPAP